MKKIVIPSSKCIPGMITAEPIIDLKTGTVIVAANQELTPSNIQNALNFVHTDIWVYLDSFNKVWNLSEKTLVSYQKYSDTLVSVIKGLDSDNLNAISDFEDYCQNLPIDFKANYSLIGCTNLIEQLDYDTYTHSLNVAFISLLICRLNNFDNDFTTSAIKAGLLHDIGMLNLSFNPFKLEKPWTSDQQMEYEKHPIFSYNMVNKLKDLDPAIGKAILAHHERCNNTGFPLHLSAPYISKLSKVLALADTYELLRNESHIFNVLKTLLVDETDAFDPQLVFTFCAYIATYFVGTYVVLSTGDIAEVVFINPVCVYRPIVKINEEFINLYDEPSIEIVSIK